MARMIPTAFGGVIVARNHLPGRKSNKSEWPHGGSLAKRAGGGIHCTLCSCQEIIGGGRFGRASALSFRVNTKDCSDRAKLVTM